MSITIRAFDGSLDDAEGLLAVERATFNECPYRADQVWPMLTDGPQRAWLAVGEGNVVGFAIAFATNALRGLSWEVDLLAVHPDWTGRGLATRLIRAAAAYGTRVALQARAVVAADNAASTRAFAQAGFRSAPELCKLLIYRLQGLAPRSWSAPSVTVRETDNLADAADWLAGLSPTQDHPNLTLLLAEQEGRPAGYAELIEVQTLLYRGVWIESLVASAWAVREALAQQAVSRAKTSGLDEIGALVPQSNWPLQQTFLAEGFRSLGDFRWFTAELPLPGPAGKDHV